MSVNDTDIELLESYLDDDLAGEQLDQLRQRLASDPALAGMIDELRGQREMRQQFFAACQPDETAVERLVQSVRRDMNRDIVWSRRARVLRGVGSLAACLLVGFFVGRATHLANSSNLETSNSPIAQVPTDQPTQPTQPTELARNSVRFDGPPAQTFRLGGPNVTALVPNNRLAGYQVGFFDGSGRVVQQFDSVEKALKFVNDQTSPTSAPSDSPAPGN